MSGEQYSDDTERPEVLNLYAGIGGNRKLWEDVNVVAVEINPDIAEYYAEQFPQDEVVVGDAHKFLREHYNEFDFIWSSVPCQTHSKVSRMMWDSDADHNESREPEYPDMRLYQEILFLKHFADCDWAVENVQSYYEPLIDPQRVGRHYIWSNYYIPPYDHGDGPGAWSNPSIEVFEEHLGFDLNGVQFEGARKDQVLRNCVDPDLGKHVLDAAFENRQTTLVAATDGGNDQPVEPDTHRSGGDDQ